MSMFKFELNESVKMRLTDERGVIRARAQYSDCADAYLIVFKAADGCQIENWWQESYIESYVPVAGDE